MVGLVLLAVSVVFLPIFLLISLSVASMVIGDLQWSLQSATAELELECMPSPLWLYTQAFLSLFSKPSKKAKGDYSKALQGIERIQVSLTTPVGLDVKRLASFLRLVEYSGPAAAGEVPLMYPIVESFKLIIQAMLMPAFPFNILGSVLTGHSTTMLRPLMADERLTFRVSIEPQGWRVTVKGDIEVDMVAEGVSMLDSQLVWRSVTTAVILNPKRVKGGAKETAGTEAGASPQQEVISTWRLPDNVGRRYGWLNGDLNPIHLHALTSRLFGFRRPIAHALFLVARAEATLRAHGVRPVYPAVFTTEFKRPTLLPATLKCTVQPPPTSSAAGGYEGVLRAGGGKVEFAIMTEDLAKPVLTGRLYVQV